MIKEEQFPEIAEGRIKKWFDFFEKELKDKLTRKQIIDVVIKHQEQVLYSMRDSISDLRINKNEYSYEIEKGILYTLKDIQSKEKFDYSNIKKNHLKNGDVFEIKKIHYYRVVDSENGKINQIEEISEEKYNEIKN